MKKIILLAVIFTGLTISPSHAASQNKLPVWKHVDRQGNVFKLCDNGNLVYRMGGNGSYGMAIFVVPGGCK